MARNLVFYGSKRHRSRMDLSPCSWLPVQWRDGLTYSSNALEGNSLTQSETKIILEEGIAIGGKPLKDHYEAIGHAEAFDNIFQIYTQKTISESIIKNLHSLFYNRIEKEKAGIYRSEKVFITGSEYPLPNPEKVPALMKSFIRKMKLERKKIHPVHFAAKIHKDFVFIHPFVDGNGRVARLLMNLVEYIRIKNPRNRPFP